MCPKGDPSAFSRRLNCMNFTVYDLKSSKGDCFFWSEDQAGKGTDEVGTCIVDYLEEKAKDGYETVICFSDATGS